MSALDEIFCPGAGGDFRLQIARISRGISASGSLTFSQRFCIAVARCVGRGLCKERAALRFVEFNVPADFYVLEFTEYVANGNERLR
eukprot:2254440-Pleurochrysis_carterae.AAC.1